MKERFRALDIIFSVIITVLLILSAALMIKITKMDNNVAQLMNKNGIGNEVTSDELVETGQELVTGDNALEIAETLNNAVSSVRHSPTYIEVQAGEGETTVLMYNTNGENITQDSDGQTMVFRKDNFGVLYSDTISYGIDCDTLRILELASMAAKEGFGKVYSVPLSSDIDAPENAAQYFVEIEGWDNIEKMYDYVDENFGFEMTSILKTNINNDDFGDTDTSILNLRFAYVLEGDNLVSGACYTYFGEETTGSWSNSYVNWYFDGVYKIEDWSLPSTWYDFDFDNAESNDETADTLANMLVDLHADISEMLESINELNSDNEILNTTEEIIETDDEIGETDSTVGETDNMSNNTSSDTDKAN